MIYATPMIIWFTCLPLPPSTVLGRIANFDYLDLDQDGFGLDLFKMKLKAQT